MIDIGKTVATLPTSPKNSRNGEGTFLRKKDGSLLYVYTHYCGESYEDHAIANLYAITSTDEGENWSQPQLFLEKDPAAENIMSPSLIRLPNGDMGILYNRKEKMPDQGVTCMPVFRSSSDEGETWSDWVFCGAPDGYYCMINDGAIVQRNGRILVALSYHGLRFDAFGCCTLDLSAQKNGDIRFVASEDNGATWYMLPTVLSTPFEDSVGFAEPGVYEHQDGELWCWFRTPYGFQYEARSADNGAHWTSPVPNFHFTSPAAPMRVKQVGPYTVALFNPTPISCVNSQMLWGAGKRTPLICAVSDRDGQDFRTFGLTLSDTSLQKFFDHCYAVESDPTNLYCYPAIYACRDGFLVAYYDSANTPNCLNAGKVKKIPFAQISSAFDETPVEEIIQK